MRVFILDDEPNIVKGLVFMICKLGLPHTEVIPFTDPGKALAAYREKPADLALVDIAMPGISGLQFIEQARLIRPCRFVILSGYSDFDYARQAIRLSIREYLVKPVDEKDLNRILSEVFMELYHVAPEAFIALFPLKKIKNVGDFNAHGKNLSKHMQDILNYINDNLGGDISITKLSDVIGLHPNYISSLFIKEMNIGLHQYVDSLKLLKAMRMLKDENTTITEIAAALGYFNERQFFRMFKKYTGKSPGEFRDTAPKPAATAGPGDPG
jgi:YesN/AraC family two-component response regulator